MPAHYFVGGIIPEPDDGTTTLEQLLEGIAPPDTASIQEALEAEPFTLGQAREIRTMLSEAGKATTVPAAPPRTYNTETAARVLQVVPHTLRVSLCQKGEYYGLRPAKAPNRRLIWDADAVDALARGHARPHR